MTSANWSEGRLECAHCGNRYLPPWREGAFRCSVCGARLPARSRRVSMRKGFAGSLIPLALAALAVVLIGARWDRPEAPRAGDLPAPARPMVRTWSEEDSRRAAEADRARHRRDLVQHPDRSAAHAAIARDLYENVRAQAAERLPPPPMEPEMGRVRGRVMQRRRDWEVAIEALIATRLADAVAPGLRHAEQAVQLAKSGLEEVTARAVRAEGLLLRGEYERAKSDYSWLTSLEPGDYLTGYVRCFEHLKQPLPPSLSNLMTPPAGPLGGGVSPTDTLQAQLDAMERWARRWPSDSVVQMRLGALCYRLAAERAVRQENMPPSGPDFAQRLDAMVYRAGPDLVRQGIRHYQRAAALADNPYARGRAMEELAHGQLLQGRPKEAIATLRKALAGAADLPLAGGYLRSAFERTNTSAPLRSREENETYGPVMGMGLDGPQMPFTPPPAGTRLRAPRQRQRPAERIAEATRLLEELDATGDRAREADGRRQDALNRLDELMPGSATEYDPATGNVVDVERGRVRLGIDRLAESLEAAGAGTYYPGPMMPSGPMPGGFPGTPPFRP